MVNKNGYELKLTTTVTYQLPYLSVDSDTQIHCSSLATSMFHTNADCALTICVSQQPSGKLAPIKMRDSAD